MLGMEALRRASGLRALRTFGVPKSPKTAGDPVRSDQHMASFTVTMTRSKETKGTFVFTRMMIPVANPRGSGRFTSRNGLRTRSGKR